MVSDDGQMFIYEGEASYSGVDKLEISVCGAGYNCYLNTLPKAYNSINYIFGLKAAYSPIKNLRLTTEYTHITPRYAETDGNTATLEKMPAYNEWLIKGDYLFDERFSFFAEINNILGSRYQQFYGYPSKGFHFLLGAKMVF